MLFLLHELDYHFRYQPSNEVSLSVRWKYCSALTITNTVHPATATHWIQSSSYLHYCIIGVIKEMWTFACLPCGIISWSSETSARQLYVLNMDRLLNTVGHLSSLQLEFYSFRPAFADIFR